MSKEGNSKKIPEWSIFDRLDEVENITLELMDKTGKITPEMSDIALASQDAHIMARYGLWALFNIMCMEGRDPVVGRELFLQQLKDWGLSEKSLVWIKKALDDIVDYAKKQKK